jgi:antitoxin component of RelBE/YafQ-DinJ toxin-antitoxin module
MTKLLEEAVQKVRALPLEMQEQAARILLAYAGDEEPILMLTPEEEADLLQAEAEMRRGEFATGAEVEAVFSKYRR